MLKKQKIEKNFSLARSITIEEDTENILRQEEYTPDTYTRTHSGEYLGCYKVMEVIA